MQQITIAGNLGSDVEVKSSNGRNFAVMRVAVTEKRKQNGQDVADTTWYDVTYNNADSNLLQYLVKGTKVIVVGKPAYRIYDSSVHHCKMVGVSVFANYIELCGQKQMQQAEERGSSQETDDDRPF